MRRLFSERRKAQSGVAVWLRRTLWLPLAVMAYLLLAASWAWLNADATLVAMIKAPNGYYPSKAPLEHARRAARIAALVAGRCQPDGWLDTAFDNCDR